MNRPIDTSLDAKVIDLYVNHRWTMRRIARSLETDHHAVQRLLARHAVAIDKRGRVCEPFSAEHRRKLSEAKVKNPSGHAFKKGEKHSWPTWSKGKKMTHDFRLKQIRVKFGLDDVYDLSPYVDLDRFLFLSRLICKLRKWLGSTESEKHRAQLDFIKRFYFDQSFNLLYDGWVKSGRNKWHRPSLDHRTPKSRGGTFDLDNLRFITWFENRAKADMDDKEWRKFKSETKTTSSLFVDQPQ